MIRRRMTVKRVDPWSVLKLGLFLNLAGGAIILITGVIVWSVIRRLQMIERGCEQIQNIFGLQECAVGGATVFRGGFLMVALFVVVFTAVLVFSAFLYNLVADLTGGVEISAIDHTAPMVAQGTQRAGGGVEVAPELQQTRAAPVVVGPSGKQVQDAAAAIPADAIDRRTREPSRLKKAAQVASTRLTEASKQASATLTEATKTEAVTRARRTEAETESFDSIWLQRPSKSSSANGSDADQSGRGGQPESGKGSQGGERSGGTNGRGSASGQSGPAGPPERTPASSSASRSSRSGAPSRGSSPRSPGSGSQPPRSRPQGESGRRSGSS